MASTKLTLVIGGLAVVGAAALFVMQHQTQQRLQATNESLQQQIIQLQTDAQDFSNRLAAFAGAKSAAGDQFNELLKLRGEAGDLRRQLAEAQKAPITTRPAQNAATENPDAEPEEVAREKMVAAKNLVAAAVMGYADHHQYQFPTNWNQVGRYFEQMERNGLNPGEAVPDTTADFNRATNEFELVYQGAITNLYGNPHWRDVIVIRERSPWQAPDGKWMKAYGFADGHSQLVTEPGGNFETFEQQHLAPTTTNQ